MKKQSIDSEKNKTFLKKLKGVICKGAIIIVIAVFTLLLIAGVPLLINGLFEKPAKCDIFAVNWNVEDALSYYAAVLGFVGTVSLGAVAVFQTDRANRQAEKANELAERMQKLEEARFLSMLSLKDLCFIRKPTKDKTIPFLCKRETEKPKYAAIDLTEDGHISKESYIVDMIIENSSDFPIGRISVIASQSDDKIENIEGVADKGGKYGIAPKEGSSIRFIIPSTHFDKTNNYKLILHIHCLNVCEYTTHLVVDIKDLQNSQGGYLHNFYMEKYDGEWREEEK